MRLSCSTAPKKKIRPCRYPGPRESVHIKLLVSPVSFSHNNVRLLMVYSPYGKFAYSNSRCACARGFIKENFQYNHRHYYIIIIMYHTSNMLKHCRVQAVISKQIQVWYIPDREVIE